ncbi:MAG TPA: hypothetical protein GX708_16665 [Gallicola sp.]|nr:hypothetical protein [Gallicola sp.]
MRKKYSLIFIILVFILTGCSEKNIETKYFEDATYLVKTVEENHPFFIKGENLSKYEKIKNEFLKESKKINNLEDFKYAIKKYIAVLGDAHMSLNFVENSLGLVNKWRYTNEGLFLLDENNNITDIKVLEIAGVPVDKILQTVDKYYAYENKAAQFENYSLYTGEGKVIELAGGEIIDDQIKVKTSNKDNSEIEFPLFMIDWFEEITKNSNYTIKTKMLDDIIYIDFRSFTVNSELEKALYFTREQVNNGVNKVIIDLRHNGGGNSEAGRFLLEAMDMAPPSYGSLVRLGPLYTEKAENIKRAEGFIEYKANLSDSIKNSSINLVVLTSIETFSSATMFGVWVQDGQLGTIIGQASKNAPNAYGDMLIFDLPNTKLSLEVSYKYFIRPDENNSKDTLKPDILVPFEEDSLDVAINFLNK